MTGSGRDRSGGPPDGEPRDGEPRDDWAGPPDDWAGPRERPGVFFRVRDGRSRFGPGCALLAVAGSVAAVVVVVLAIRLIASLLGDVTLR